MTNNQMLALVAIGALGAYFYSKRGAAAPGGAAFSAPGTTISTSTGSYVVDEMGRKYWLDATGNIVYATDAAGNPVAVPPTPPLQDTYGVYL